MRWNLFLVSKHLIQLAVGTILHYNAVTHLLGANTPGGTSQQVRTRAASIAGIASILLYACPRDILV